MRHNLDKHDVTDTLKELGATALNCVCSNIYGTQIREVFSKSRLLLLTPTSFYLQKQKRKEKKLFYGG